MVLTLCPTTHSVSVGFLEWAPQVWHGRTLRVSTHSPLFSHIFSHTSRDPSQIALSGYLKLYQEDAYLLLLVSFTSSCQQSLLVYPFAYLWLKVMLLICVVTSSLPQKAFITIFLAAWIQIRLHYGISSPGCTRKWGVIFHLPACHKWLIFELILPSSSFQTTLKPSCLIPQRKESCFLPLRTNQALGSLSITRDSYLPLAVTELWLGACVSS